MFRAYYITKPRNLYIVRHIDYTGSDTEISQHKKELDALTEALACSVRTGLRVCMGQPIPPALAEKGALSWYEVATEPVRTMTVRQAAKHLSVSESRVRALAKTKLISFKRGRDLEIYAESVERYAAEPRQAGNKKLYTYSPGWKKAQTKKKGKTK